MKLKKMFLLLILVLLFLGVSYAAEANNDTTTTDTQQILKESSTTTDPIDTNIKQENSINKEIKKQTTENKTTKTATKNYDVTDYNTLHNALTADTYNTVTININSDIKLAGNTTLNEAITSLTINGNGKTVNGDDKYQFLYIASYSNVNISNLKITNCNGIEGGAIFHLGDWDRKWEGTLIISNSIFNNNKATSKYSGGGAIFNCLDTIIITNTTFNNNTGTKTGGAIHNGEGGFITITNATFNNNKATKNGGAIHNDFEAILTITNTTFNNNTATEDGGAIHNNFNSMLTISNTTFNNNTAQNGGAINNYDMSTLTVTNTTFNNNKATEDGGAIHNNVDTTITITNTTFNNNNAQNGGAIYNNNSYSTHTVTNTTFNNNTANCGAAIFISNIFYDGTITITNSTFNNNNAQNGGAIFISKIFQEGTITITNSTFNNNTAKNNGAAIYNEGSITVTNNIFDQNIANATGKAIINIGNALITNNTYSETSKYSSTIYTNATEATITNNIFLDGHYTKIIITTNNTNPYINDTIKIFFALKNQDNQAITNEEIITTFNGEKYTLTTDTEGITNLTFRATTYGTYKITAEYMGNVTNAPAFNTSSIYVKPYTWIKIGYNGYVNKGSTVKILARILNDTAAVKYVPVYVTIDNKTYKIKSDGAGYIRLNYTVDDYDDHKITFKFKGNSKYHAVTNSTILKVIKPTQILMAKMTNVPYGYNVKVVGRLMQDDNPIKYVFVNVTINDKEYTLKTDGAGYFRLNYTVDNYDEQKITFKFNGNNKYLASSNSTTFKVKQLTWIKHATITRVKQGSTVKIVGRVLYNETNPLKYVPIKVTLNDNVYTLKTNGAGYYTLNYTATDIGTITFTTIFNGNKLYHRSTTSTKFTVIK